MTWLDVSTHRRCSEMPSSQLNPSRHFGASLSRTAASWRRSSSTQTGIPERTLVPGRMHWFGSLVSIPRASQGRSVDSSNPGSWSAPGGRTRTEQRSTRSTWTSSKTEPEWVTEDSPTGSTGLPISTEWVTESYGMGNREFHPPVMTSQEEPVSTSRDRFAPRTRHTSLAGKSRITDATRAMRSPDTSRTFSACVGTSKPTSKEPQ